MPHPILQVENLTKSFGDLVLFEKISFGLDEGDRILVINSGHVTGIVDARHVTKEEIGLLMTKTEERAANE